MKCVCGHESIEHNHKISSSVCGNECQCAEYVEDGQFSRICDNPIDFELEYAQTLDAFLDMYKAYPTITPLDPDITPTPGGKTR